MQALPTASPTPPGRSFFACCAPAARTPWGAEREAHTVGRRRGAGDTGARPSERRVGACWRRCPCRRVRTSGADPLTASAMGALPCAQNVQPCRPGGGQRRVPDRGAPAQGVDTEVMVLVMWYPRA
eukprot:354903-Chlamydomonas_euryale.AAC.18